MLSRRIPNGCLLILALSSVGLINAEEAFRPPAVPLIACDPYFSVWSQADRLYDTETTHWTGKPHRLSALLRVDGRTYRLMGGAFDSLPVMKQTSVEVLPTRTIYRFSHPDVTVKFTFTTPALPANLMVLSRPTTHVTCEVQSTSAQTHCVEFYFDAGGELSSNTLDQLVTGCAEVFRRAKALKIGTLSQPVLKKAGDDLRIDWGYLYLATAKESEASMVFGDPIALKQAFVFGGAEAVSGHTARFPANAGEVVAAAALNLGNVSQSPVSQYVLVAYDDLYSIEYMKSKLRPYWRKDGDRYYEIIRSVAVTTRPGDTH